MAIYLPRLSIVLFNTEGDVGVTDRDVCMDRILNSILNLNQNYPNLFILAQDKINRAKHLTLCTTLHQNPIAIPHRSQAGVYYDPNTLYDVEYVNVAQLQQVNDALAHEGDNVFTVSRLTACVLTPTAVITTGKKILLISWHGPSKAQSEVKHDCFLRLVRFLEQLKDQKGCDMVIVGGDFNFPSEEARWVLDIYAFDGVVSDSYTPTVDRQEGGPIDYVVYWPGDGLHVTDISVVMPDFRREHGNRPFDHNIVLYRLEEIETVSDLARQFGSITVYEDEE